MLDGFRLCLRTSEATILARAAEAAAAGNLALVNTGETGGQGSEAVKPPPRIGIYALRPPPVEAAELGTVALHRRLAIMRAQPPQKHVETYERINAIATDLRIGLKLSLDDRMNLLASLIHEEDFPLTMLPYLVDVFCDLAGALSESRLKASVKEASRSFNQFLWDNENLADEDWVIFANETVRLFHGTPFLYQILAELYHQRRSPAETNSSVLDSISSLPKLGAGIAGEVASAALARYRFTDEDDFADALEFITAPAFSGHSTAENAVHQIGVIANGNSDLTETQLEMLRQAVMGLVASGSDSILSGWTLARIAGHPNYPESDRLRELVSLARNLIWPPNAIDEFILAVAYVTRNDPKLRDIPRNLVSHLGEHGIHIGRTSPDNQNPTYRTERGLFLLAWILILEFFQPYRRQLGLDGQRTEAHSRVA